MAVERVIVDIYLGVERDEVALLRLDEGVYLRERAVVRDEGLVNSRQNAGDDAGLLCVAGELLADGEGLEGVQAEARLERDLDDGLRVRARDLLYLYAALARAHERNRLGVAVVDEAEVILLRDARRLLD